MSDIKKIVFPVDFSERSKGTAHYVEAIAAKFNPAIELIHVLPPLHYEAMSLEISGPALAEVMESREIAMNAQMKKFLADELHPYRVNRSVVDGDPATEIVKLAKETKADLIVMSTHGYGPFRRFILGSVASKVLHDTACPVFTGVHMEKAPEKVDIRRVVVALDLETYSETVLDWAAGIAKKFDAKLIVTHVLASPDDREEQSARARIDALLKTAGMEASVVIDTGDPSKQICELAEAEKAGLLVIGRGHSEGIFGRLRTHSYAIIRMAPCPVVSV